MPRLTLDINNGSIWTPACSGQISQSVFNIRGYIANDTAACDPDSPINVYDRLTDQLLVTITEQTSTYTTISAPNGIRFDRVPPCECDDDADCEKGEKCVDCECIPCEKLVDGAGTVTLYYKDALHGQTADAFTINVATGTIEVQSEVFSGVGLYAGVLVVPNGFNGNILIQGFHGPLGSSFWQKEVYSGSAPSGTQKIEFLFDTTELPIGSLWSGKVQLTITNFTDLGECADDLSEPTEPEPPPLPPLS